MNERTIFLTAVELKTPEARAAFLDEQCAQDAALRGRIEALLKAHEQQGGVVDVLVGSDEPTSSMHSLNEAAPPERAIDPEDLNFLGPSTTPGSLGSLGPYEVIEVIGRGGMGLVLKARDTKLQRIVAIKVLAPEIASNKSAKKRFEREAQAAAAVSHDHIVTIHAVEEFNSLPYLVMECIIGRSLQQKIEETGPLELKEILRIGMQAALGLAAAHKQGLVHRDIKPANILLQNGIQRVKITDFGLARAVDDVGMTHTGQIAGTPLYMSPEQAQGQKVDHTSDLFSLGSVLYTMCAGRPAFRAPNTVAVLRRVVDDTPRPIREINSDLPSWLADIVSKLMSKEKNERFQTAAEVADLLSKRLARLQEPKSSVTTSAAPSAPVKRNGESRVKSLDASRIQSASRVKEESPPELPARSRRLKPVRRATWWDRLRAASPLTWMVGAVLVPGTIVLIVMMAMLLNRDQLLVRIELDESLRQQDVTVIVDGTSYAARDLGPSIRVKPGPHTLEVKRGSEQFKSEQFTILQNEKPLFRVKIDNGRLSVERADPGTTPVKLADTARGELPSMPTLRHKSTDTPEYRRFVEWVKLRGGSVSPEFPPNGALPETVTMYMDHTKKFLSDSDLEKYADLPGVQNTLGFRFQPLTTAGMIRLGKIMEDKPIGQIALYDMPVGLDWLRDPGRFAAVYGATFQNIEATDAQIANLKNLPQLTYLNLMYNKNVTDASVVHLENRTEFNFLLLEFSGISEAGLTKLRAALPNCKITPAASSEAKGVTVTPEYKRFVEWIKSRGGSVTPEFPPNGELPHIVSLPSDRPFTDEDFEHFRDLPGVQNALGIHSPSLSTADMIQLGRVMKGKPIGGGTGLVDTPIGLDWLREPGGFVVSSGFTFQNIDAKNEQLAALKNFPNLRALNLRFNKDITDEAVVYLQELKELKALNLDGTGITEAGLAKLRAGLPGCEITPTLKDAKKTP